MTGDPRLAAQRRLHERLRARVLAAISAAAEDLSAVAHDGAGDTMYAVDRVAEEVLRDLVAEEFRDLLPLRLVAEGLEGGETVVGAGAPQWVLIVDPIDGTRGLMHQKRPAWILSALAHERGPATGLHDLVWAVQTEIPLLKQYLADQWWAEVGGGAAGERWNRLSDERQSLMPRPSRATGLEHGFSTIVRYFPGVRGALGRLDDDLHAALLGRPQSGKALCFEDQYISTGGHLAELLAGHDRFIADLRPLLPGFGGLCCHPYDLCTALIAREAGAVVCAPDGGSLTAPLSVEGDVAWAAYANPALQALVQPVLVERLRQRG